MYVNGYGISLNSFKLTFISILHENSRNSFPFSVIFFNKISTAWENLFCMRLITQTNCSSCGVEIARPSTPLRMSWSIEGSVNQSNHQSESWSPTSSMEIPRHSHWVVWNRLHCTECMFSHTMVLSVFYQQRHLQRLQQSKNQVTQKSTEFWTSNVYLFKMEQTRVQYTCVRLLERYIHPDWPMSMTLQQWRHGQVL